MFHTDSVVTLATGFEELGKNPLRWFHILHSISVAHITSREKGRQRGKCGCSAAVSLTGSMLGDLGNLGGKVRFPEVGTYTRPVASVTLAEIS